MPPIAIPSAIEHERAQRRQGIARRQIPVHAGPFLALRHEQIVSFFGMSTPDVLAVAPPLAIVGQVGLAVAQLLDSSSSRSTLRAWGRYALGSARAASTAPCHVCWYSGPSNAAFAFRSWQIRLPSSAHRLRS